MELLDRLLDTERMLWTNSRSENKRTIERYMEALRRGDAGGGPELTARP